MTKRLKSRRMTFRTIREKVSAPIHWLSRSLRGEPTTNHATASARITVRKEWTVSPAAGTGFDRALKSMSGPNLGNLIEEGIRLGFWLDGEPLKVGMQSWAMHPTWDVVDQASALTVSEEPDLTASGEWLEMGGEWIDPKVLDDKTLAAIHAKLNEEEK